MKVLFLAPQPFFQERGTPIAVRLALEVLAERQQDRIDLLTYHEGREITIPNLTIRRIPNPFRISGVGPGISLKKLVCDLVFLFSAIRLVRRSRSDQYQLIHAVEESVFVAALLKLVWKIPYVYDMDSSLAMQLTEKWGWLRPFRILLGRLERFAIRGSIAVVPVCDALAAIADKHGSVDTMVLRDVSLLSHENASKSTTNLRRETEAGDDAVLLLYIGNLESYQGIDLLVESFAAISATCPKALLVIIGGTPAHIARYTALAESRGCAHSTRFLGPRPVEQLSSYLIQADVLLSPRVKGNNTPMKIYSYLHSGVPVLATDLPTHSQVLTPEVAELTPPTIEGYGAGIRKLVDNPLLRRKLGAAGRALAERLYTFPVFRRSVNELYDRITVRCAGAPPATDQKLSAASR